MVATPNRGKVLNQRESFGMSGPEGIKFDRIELVNLDFDGDLDVLTCEEPHVVGEERVDLGAIWSDSSL